MESSLDGLDGSTAGEKTTWAFEKVHGIKEACKWKNLDQLRSFAESKGGFLTDDLRQQACMSLAVNGRGSKLS